MVPRYVTTTTIVLVVSGGGGDAREKSVATIFFIVVIADAWLDRFNVDLLRSLRQDNSPFACATLVFFVVYCRTRILAMS